MDKAQVIISMDEYKQLIKSKDVALTAEKLDQMLKDLEDIFTTPEVYERNFTVIAKRVLAMVSNLQKLLHSSDELL